MLLENICKAVVDQAATRTSTFYRIDIVNTAMRNKNIVAMKDWLNRAPKKLGLQALVNEAVEKHIDGELKRRDGGWRVFESFPDPQGGKARLWIPLRCMNLKQLIGAKQQVREERRDMMTKEERYEILEELLRLRGPSAKVADVIEDANAEIVRRHASA